jgi:hypothetical protein
VIRVVSRFYASLVNESQTIPASELRLLESATLPELSTDDVYTFLAAKVRRGRAICIILLLIAVAGIFLALLVYHSLPWVVLSATGFIAFRVWAMLSQRKLELAHHISVEPRLVYWVHPRVSTVRGYEVLLTLHSRTGQSLEVAMSKKQMLNVVAWLRRSNPDVRCGAYDDIPEKTK